MRTLKISLLVFILSITISAQESIVWEKINGPLYPTTPYSFLITSNGTQFVGAEAPNYLAHNDVGLFRSTDDGQTWELKNDGINGLRITCLAEAPNGWLYAGNYEGLNGFIFRSQNNGDSWQSVAGSGYPEVRSIKFNSNGHIYVGASDGFRISINNGNNWTRKNTGLLGVGITSIEILGDTLIFVTTEQGVHKSSNEGDTWIPVNNGLIPWGNYIISYKVIWFDNTLYVSLRNGLYSSTNFGESWIRISELNWVMNLEIDENNIFYLYQEITNNLLRSYDYGISWDTAYVFPGWSPFFKIIDGDSIYASYSGSVNLSTDSGSTFTRHVSIEYIPAEISCFKIINEDLWFAGTYQGIYSSTDKGQNWQKIGPINAAAGGISFNTPSEVFAICASRLYKTTDLGTNWVLINSPPFTEQAIFTYHLTEDDEIYAVYKEYNNSYIVKLNSENTWDSLAFFGGPGYGYCAVIRILVDMFDDAYLSVVYRDYNYGPWYITYKEFDNFNTFQTIFNQISTFALNDSGYVFFANSKMYRTTDRGTTIEEINNGITNLKASTIKVIDFDEIYIGDNMKLYLSTNNGDYWYTIPGPSGTSLTEEIHSIEKVGEGYLVIASRFGIYKNTTVVSVEEIGNSNFIQLNFSLYQNYPNPFNPSTSLQYTIGSRQFVTLKVFDLLGREVATLVSEEKPAGEYEVEFNAANLPSGIYFYQLKAGEFTQTKKMILLR